MKSFDFKLTLSLLKKNFNEKLVTYLIWKLEQFLDLKKFSSLSLLNFVYYTQEYLLESGNPNLINRAFEKLKEVYCSDETGI